MNAPVRVTSVVEGYGEVAAVPILLRRICAERGLFPAVDQPHRVRRSDFGDGRVAKAYHLQRLRAGENGVVVLLCDADDDEAEALRTRVRREVGEAAGTVVAVAVREYEAWFLAGLSSLRGHRSVRDDAAFTGDPESPRNAKKPLEAAMTESYKETLHQAAFSEMVDLDLVRAAAPAFRAFCEQLWNALEAPDER